MATYAYFQQTGTSILFYFCCHSQYPKSLWKKSTAGYADKVNIALVKNVKEDSHLLN